MTPAQQEGHGANGSRKLTAFLLMIMHTRRGERHLDYNKITLREVIVSALLFVVLLLLTL